MAKSSFRCVGITIINIFSLIDNGMVVRNKTKNRLSGIPDGLNRELYKVFEKYNLGDKSMLCLWKEGQLNCALREPVREYELQTRLKEWMEDS